jgi:dolichol-phosphate mannosyltransferase
VTPVARRALVTGGAGFIGANLVRRLVAEGLEVHALVRPGGDAWRLTDVPEARLRETDVTDGDRLTALVESLRPHWVFHLAAHGAYSWQTDAARMVDVNVGATIALLEAAAGAGCEAFVHAGTSSEYGTVDHPPTEEEPLRPNSAYAVTKAAATLFCSHASRERRLPVSVLRLYSAYGRWEEPGRLMPTLVTCALRGGLPPLVEPGTARDFVHVDDVVNAFLDVAAAPEAAGPVLNVGSGEQTTLGDLVALAQRVFGVTEKPRWATAAPRSWDTDVWVADPSAIRQRIGWTPTRSLEDGLRGLAEWLASEPRLTERYLAAVPPAP